MPASETPAVVSGACRFGAQRLLPLIDALTKEINGVKTGRDIEHIHRMRVASRRLRAALPLFAQCFSGKKFRTWVREIKKITRALGEARDLDVQIAFLAGYLKGLSRMGTTNAMKATDAEPSPTPASKKSTPPGAIALLISRLQQRRGTLQKKVLLALEELERSHVIDEMQGALREMVPVASRMRRRPPMYGIPPVAAERISQGILALFVYEPWIRSPDAVAEHHAMRIAAKRLRYTMEVYAPVYRLEFKKPLARIKKIQTILGDMHDCDVWIDQISLAIVKERTRVHSVKDVNNTRSATLLSLKQLLTDRERKRAQLHRGFVRFWDSLAHTRFFDELRASLLADVKVGFSLRKPRTPAENAPAAVTAEREAVTRLATVYPAGVEHAGQVAVLALQLFDQLQPLHQLDGRDRIMLEYACTVHDIGWKFGQKRHQVRSADMIFSDETLILDIRERGILALVARLHAGRCRTAQWGYFQCLFPQEQSRVLALAALIRVADGLDYRHLGIVQGVHCTIGDAIVTCDVIANGDVSVEKVRALAKSDLFSEVFNHLLVIP
ncbi:MAG: CHAD domain-containing protein [Methanoregula sp.]|nr:CHAD domain-containing protein [Methanoregula sp.]